MIIPNSRKSMVKALTADSTEDCYIPYESDVAMMSKVHYSFSPVWPENDPAEIK